MSGIQLDAHQKPPEALQAFYKKYQRLPSQALDQDDSIVDFARATCDIDKQGLRVVRTLEFPMLLAQSSGLVGWNSSTTQASHFVDVFEHSSFPGGLKMCCSEVDVLF